MTADPRLVEAARLLGPDPGGCCPGGCVHSELGKCRNCGHVADLTCYRCGVSLTAGQYDNAGGNWCLDCDDVVYRECLELGRSLLPRLWSEA